MALLEVVKKGKYFNPAFLHYGYETCVVCDRCNRTYLMACIGYDINDKGYDLCLTCVDELVRLTKQNKRSIYINSETNIPSRMQPQIRTRMLQDMLRPNFISKNPNQNSPIPQNHNQNKKNGINECNTFMLQDLFNKN